MKKIIISIFLFSNIVSFSQTLQSLKSDTKNYYEATYNMAFEEVLDYTYPKVYAASSKEQMLDSLNTSFENENYKLRLVHPNPEFTYSELKQIDSRLFCVINYKRAIRITYEVPLSETKVKNLEKTYKENGEYSTVLFEKRRNSFFLEGKATMIAIAEEATQNKWKFINHSLEQAPFVKNLLDERIFNELGLK